MSRRHRSIASGACLATLALVAAGCGSASSTRPSGPAVTVPAVPLNAAVTTAAGTWATVVMGGSAAQHNNFWQLFIRPSGGTPWKLVTPPGTADNGGLVLGGSTGQALVAAFRPSQDLTYTPLTQTKNGGHTWSALSPLDAALASTPDSIAVQPGTSRLLTLLEGGTAEQGAPGGTNWSNLVTARALAATPTGRSCGLRALTAVAYSPAGTALVAGTCTRPGIVGIFAEASHTWQATGPTLPGALARQPMSVLRLTTTGNQITALLAVGIGPHTSLLAAWSGDGGARWTLSPLLMTGGQAITAASIGTGQTAAVITAGSHGAELAHGSWQILPALPPGTLTLAPGTDGTIDALAVHRATLTVWQLASSGGSWAKKQTITVPIVYGSSG